MQKAPETVLNEACVAYREAFAALKGLREALSKETAAHWVPPGQFAVLPMDDERPWFDVSIADLRLRFGLSLTADLKGVITVYRLSAAGSQAIEILESARFQTDNGKLEEKAPDGSDQYLTVATLARRFGVAAMARAAERPRPGEAGLGLLGWMGEQISAQS